MTANLQGDISVYLVEDDPDDVYLVKKYLSRETDSNFKLSHINSLAELQEKLDSSVPDIVLLDLGLMESVGIETLEQATQILQDIPIIVLTGFDEEKFGKRAIQLGAQDYIPKKELNENLLKRMIGYALERRGFEARKMSTFAQIVEDSDNIVMVTDLQGNIEFVNSTAEHHYGYSESELLGANISILKSDKHDDELDTRMWQALNAGRPFDGVFINQTKHGELIYEKKKIRPLAVKDEKAEHFISIGNSISESITEMQDRLTIIRRVSNSIQHRFNNILQAVLGGVHLAKTNLVKGDIPKAEKMLDSVLTSANYAADIVKKVSLIGDVQNEKVSIEDIGQLVNDCVTVWQGKLNNSVKLRFVSEDNLPDIPVIKNHVMIAVDALIDNAIKASPEDSEVLVNVSSRLSISEICHVTKEVISGPQIVITVQDHGVGIAQELQKDIFEPFFTTSQDSFKATDNTGLGLSITRNVMHSHSGHIQLHSNPGNTRISLLFPVTH